MPQKSDRVITENPMSEHGVGTRGDWGWGTVLERFEGGSCGEEQLMGLPAVMSANVVCGRLTLGPSLHNTSKVPTCP